MSLPKWPDIEHDQTHIYIYIYIILQFCLEGFAPQVLVHLILYLVVEPPNLKNMRTVKLDHATPRNRG